MPLPTYDDFAAIRRELARSRPKLDTIPDRRGIGAWRRALIRRLRATWAIPARPSRPPAARERGRERRDGYDLCRIDLDGERHPIPACLLVPHGAGREMPAALCMHGNVPGAKDEVAGEEERPGAAEGVSRFHDDYGRKLAQQGVLCLVIDEPLQGERAPSPADAGTREAYFDAAVMALLAAGRTYLGTALGDQAEALGYLLSLPHVDRRRVGTIGFSMGGTLAAALAALDRRVRCVCCSGYVLAWRHRLAQQTVPQALLNYVPGMLEWFDLPHLLAAVAPTPMLLAAEARGAADLEEQWLQPVRAAYDAWAAPGALRIWRPPVGPHRFHPQPCLPCFHTMLTCNR